MSDDNPRTPELRAYLGSFLARVKHAGHDACVLRNHEELPDYTRHDVDLLVPPENVRDIACSGKKGSPLFAMRVTVA